jgi:hypothetical protein
VTAENAGTSPLIANRAAVGGWESFVELDAGAGNIALLALANNKIVCADNGGTSPLISNRVAIGGWESFTVGYPAQGTGSFSVTGSEQPKVVYVGAQNVPQTIWDQGTVSITINGRTVSTAYGSASTSSSLASALASAVNGDAQASSYVTATLNGSTVSLTAKSPGSAGNYSLSGGSSTSMSQVSGQPGFSSPSFSVQTSGSSMTGGNP